MVRLSILAASAAFLVSSVAFGQASAPKSREQVKEETRAAQKAGELTPAGGGHAPQTKSASTGKKMTREERKAETQAAQKAGELTPAGGGHAPQTKSTQTGSKMTKEQRKAETAEARKKGELVPAGGGSPQPKQ